MSIPLVNLKRQYAEIQEPVRRAIDRVLDNQAFIQGPVVAEFTEAYRVALGARHVIGCSNGTAAIEIALRAYGIGAGDEVITVSHTFFATVEAILNVNAVPVYVDVDPDTYNLNPAMLEAAITPRTRAVIPVHLYGMPCDMDAIRSIAARHSLVVIEDAAQAHLAKYKGRIVGSDSDVATFSFYPGKNLGAYGDSGAIVCRDDVLAERMKRLCDHGRSGKYTHDMVGSNHRMDALQAAVLTTKLPYLERWNDRRKEVAKRYQAALEPRGFRSQSAPEGGESSYHLFVVQVANRDETLARLNGNGIGAGIHYPVPVHRQKAVESLVPASLDLPVTDALARRIISLPICGSISDDEVDQVCKFFLSVAKPPND